MKRRLFGLAFGFLLGAGGYVLVMTLPGRAHSGFVAQAALPALDQDTPSRVATATFACGCFWGPDARFGAVPGVVRTRVGYCGGTSPHPTYEQIGDHTETVEVDFDPARISFVQLMDLYVKLPNVRNTPWKRQYRNAVFYHDREQKSVIEGLLPPYVHVDVEPFREFTWAEDHHQKYQLQSTALMADYSRCFPDFHAFVNSTAVARANAFITGYGTEAEVRTALPVLGLSAEHQKELLELHQKPGFHCN